MLLESLLRAPMIGYCMSEGSLKSLATMVDEAYPHVAGAIISGPPRLDPAAAGRREP